MSPLADHAYSQLWVPLTATSLLKDTWNDNYMGMLSSTILARDKSDFPAILAELDKIKANINTQMKAKQRLPVCVAQPPVHHRKGRCGQVG